MEPPVGTVALLFTDIVGSTTLARELGPEWASVLGAHHEIVGGAIEANGGYIDGREGDAFFAVFADPRAAVAAAVSAQRGLRARTWPTSDGHLRVRMGLHAGYVERLANAYAGLEIHRAARVAAAAHGGQILMTDAVLTLARDAVQADDLGEHRLKDFPLPERLFCAVVDGEGAAAFPPPRTLAVRPTNLPADDRLLIGRDAELTELAAAFAAGERLVTVTGMGGSGKSRLAIAAAGTLFDTHPGGVWWLELAAATEPNAPLFALAAALHLADDGQRSLREALAGRIGDRPTLAVVDNLEHLPQAGVELAGLMAAAPGLRVLATSRVPLRVGGERVLTLQPLPTTAATDLLRRLGTRARPGLVLSDELADQLCERLDHLPLAIELAAARLAVLTPEQLLERLASPLMLLKGGGRDVPARQRSLRATIEWSLELLEGEPRELFRRLGVFAGAVELEDIEAICGDDGLAVLDGVAALLEANLLRRIEDRSGAVRFQLPEALRQVAIELLDATPDGERRRRTHAEHIARVVGPGSSPFIATVADFTRATALQRDVQAALAWARIHDRGLAQALAAMRAAWLSNAGPLAEPLALAREALAGDDAPPEVHAQALIVMGQVEGKLGNNIRRAELAAQAADLLPVGHDLRIAALCGLALTRALGRLGGELEADAMLHAEAEQYGSVRSRANAAFARAEVMVQLEDLAAATAALDVAAALAASESLMGAGWVDSVRADVHLVAGEYEQAAAGYLRSMQTAWIDGELGQLFNDLQTIAVALVGAGHMEAALEVDSMAMAHGEEMGTGVGTLDAVVGSEHIQTARERLPADVVAGAIARGRAVPLERRIDRVREFVAALSAATA